MSLPGADTVTASAPAEPAGTITPTTPGWPSRWTHGVNYGGLALALYAVLPNHYASEYGTPLALLGAVLLAARLLDAVADPLIGRWADALFARRARRAWVVVAAAAVVLALGVRALFFPAVQGQAELLGCRPAYEPLFLASYFVAGALSIPLWVRAVKRFGLSPTWLAGMLRAIAVFAWAALLGSGDVAGFTEVTLAFYKN